MEIKIGDKVKFLNESGGGIVINIIDKKKVIVQIEDGFEIPVLMDKLIIIEPTNHKNKTIEEKKKIQSLDNTNKRLDKQIKTIHIKSVKEFDEIPKPLFAITLVGESTDDEERVFILYLLNDGDYLLNYAISLKKNDKLRLLDKGELEPGTLANIGSIQNKQLLSFQAIVIDILFYSEYVFKAQPPIHYMLNLQTMEKPFISNFKETEYFDDPAYLIDLLDYRIFENHLFEKKNIKVKDLIEKKSEKKQDKNVTEIEKVDLHIEEIIDNEKGLSNGEIINIQMARFATALEGALKGKTKKIVFIHGVGNGKLRYEFRKTLDTKYPDLKYQDASFAEYGYGATMVIFK